VGWFACSLPYLALPCLALPYRAWEVLASGIETGSILPYPVSSPISAGHFRVTTNLQRNVFVTWFPGNDASSPTTSLRYRYFFLSFLLDPRSSEDNRIVRKCRKPGDGRRGMMTLMRMRMRRILRFELLYIYSFYIFTLIYGLRGCG